MLISNARSVAELAIELKCFRTPFPKSELLPAKTRKPFLQQDVLSRANSVFLNDFCASKVMTHWKLLTAIPSDGQYWYSPSTIIHTSHSSIILLIFILHSSIFFFMFPLNILPRSSIYTPPNSSPFFLSLPHSSTHFFAPHRSFSLFLPLHSWLFLTLPQWNYGIKILFKKDYSI